MSIILLMLLTLIVFGLLGLSSIELQRTGRESYAAVARANARLALAEAIGQLQRHAGPDQRVTATAEILGDQIAQPHWTGVWRSTLADGTPVLKRDDLNGGLRDTRQSEGVNREGKALAWLVSGAAKPSDRPGKDHVTLVGSGSVDSAKPAVQVEKLALEDEHGDATGHYAWWTGDLGVRANISTSDPHAAVAAQPADPGNGGMYRVMASQAADASMMGAGAKFDEGEERRLASRGTATLSSAGKSWSREHAFDFTVESSGVLADVASGGLKRDLTAYFQSTGNIPEIPNAGGLRDDDALVGVDADQQKSSVSPRHARSAPRFGVLRDWVRATTSFNRGDAPSRLPELDTSAAGLSRNLALANESAVKLAGNHLSSLQPILVEATNFTHMSTYVHIDGATKIFQIRQLMYPRVVLWNPYNVRMKSDRMIAMIQGNGRQEMWTENFNANNLPAYAFRKETQWLMFEGGRSTAFNGAGSIMNSEGYNDPYMGSYYFSVPSTTFEPGECLVFSPSHSAEYDGLSAYRLGSYDLANNDLACNVPPDPSRCYYVSASEIGGGINFQPIKYWYAPTPYWSSGGRNGVENQSDDTRVILKSMGNRSKVTFEEFDALPQVAVVSASLQFGAGREPRIAWSNYERMPIQLLDRASPKPTDIPNVRTREGIRLRWFDEHPSNLLGSGKLSGTPHFEEALLANWNPRASFVIRSPWENVAGTLPTTGSGGGPWFFGAYTRDLFDQAVSWPEQVPVPHDGRYCGNPFGTPQEGTGRYVLFDVPRNETGVISLAQLQHAKISDLIWHPSNAIGNSLVDPRLGNGENQGMSRTAAIASNPASAQLGGFHERDLGWSSDSQRSGGDGGWALAARSILANAPAQDNLVYDLSFEVNRTLWDRYYLSSGNEVQKTAFMGDPEGEPLPNGRMKLAPATRGTADTAGISDFHRAAYHLMVDGAFNVNSTRVEAWKALLASTRRSGYGKEGGIPFPRVLNAPGGAWKTGQMVDGDEAWAGHRELTEGEIDTLAQAIVQEVKLRGPFLSMADFVNRRLAEDETGRMGALQAAIERANLNRSLISAFPLDNKHSLPDYQHPDNIQDATRLEQTLKPSSKAWGAPAYLTQADVLQVIGPALSARSDTFVVRAYGDALDGHGEVQARAWCEAVIQRTPVPVKADESGINPENPNQAGDFGRRFAITGFRWLQPAEI
ncbi:hypothetical protein [Luteolibacter luteus]|uniref:Uncharacterized protein n=1 Tax=Luteolibacter luteus TaxID=2728835 RepID=A0A858RHM9_9BACT|nr:hypothetical protein [Luteolibacter luteus]QJE96081.1 hypothetical protein HHL09_09890 [Luteolibacter luteus]